MTRVGNYTQIVHKGMDCVQDPEPGCERGRQRRADQNALKRGIESGRIPNSPSSRIPHLSQVRRGCLAGFLRGWQITSRAGFQRERRLNTGTKG